ncbi:MAG: hypothetical protein MR290_02510 [Ruminococcus sp.]|nr:hypothetical protein [Ruminococcus sp.]
MLKTRGLADFRAEYNIWRKDLAAELDLREGELERLELTGEVPETAAQMLTEKYALPENYFTEDIERAAVLAAAAERYEPKNPFAYFLKVGFIWELLLGCAGYILNLPLFISSFFNQSVSDNLFAIETVCLGIVQIVSGIYLGSHILKKTNFRGSIADYEFLYPYLPGIVGSLLTGLVPHTAQRLTDAGSIGSMAFSVGLGFTVSLFSAAIGIFFLAYLLDTAARADGADKDKRLKILCAVVLASKCFSYLGLFVRGSFLEADLLSWVHHALSLLLLLAVLYGVLFGIQKNPRFKTLWLTVLPILAMAVPTVFTVIKTLMG